MSLSSHSVTLFLEAVYADGFDNAVVNPLTREIAAARDAAGEPYTVLLLADSRRHAVMDISWRDRYCCVSRFDGAGRQLSCHELRGAPDGDLFLRKAATWAGAPGVGEHEFLHVAARHVTTYRLSGYRNDIDEPSGDRGPRRETFTSQSPPRVPIPLFGQWQGLLALTGDEIGGITDAGRNPLPVRMASRPPWLPPRPLQPYGIDELVRPGSERLIGDRRLRLSAHAAGPLSLPSGSLVAADPSSLDYDGRPFTATVPPGAYPVTISLATFVDDPGHSRVAAARLDISDHAAVQWELALRDGEDLFDLGDRQYFGFGVDAGMACFTDAEACDRLSEAWRTFDGLVEPRYLALGDGDMVAWSSGWGDGSYPTWIGRDPAGAIACFVADMQLFPAEAG